MSGYKEYICKAYNTEKFEREVCYSKVLVRCKDCRFWNLDALQCDKENGLIMAEPYDFCSRSAPRKYE